MRRIISALLMCIPLSALADGQASLIDGKGDPSSAVEVRWAGDQMRVDFPRHASKGYLLMQGNNGYLVTNISGQPLALDIRDAQALAGQLGADKAASLSSYQAQSVSALSPTGANEVVAGIQGQVYRLDWVTQEGENRQDQLVLSDAPEAQELLTMFDRYQTNLTGHADPVAAMLRERGLGILRFGDKFQVASLSSTTPDMSLFAMPAKSGGLNDLLKSMIQ